MPILNSHVLMSDAVHFSLDQPINAYYSNDTLNLNAVQTEHATIKACLEEAGITVTQVPSPANSQDGVFTANWGLIRGKKVVLSRLPNARKAEEPYAEKVFADLGLEVIHVPDGYKWSGQGDALPYGDYLFCGQGYRADMEAQAFAAEQLGYKRIQLQTIPELDEHGQPVINKVSGWPDSFFYDIDLTLAIIRPPEGDKKGLIAYCKEAFTPESQQILDEFDGADKIIISLEEARQFACNLVSTGKTVIMGEHAPKLAANLAAHGLKVVTPRITELVKGGGYIRCTTLTFN